MKGKSAVFKLSVCAIFLLALMLAVLTSAQETAAQPAALTSPDVNYPLHFDISRPLRDMATEVSSPAGAHVAPPVRYPKLQLLKEAAQRGQQAMEDGAIQTSSGPLVSAIVGLNLLGVGNGFPGYSVPDAPTDVNLAVGDTQVLQWVNVSYAIFDKTTGAVIMGPILGNAFWSGFGGACQTSNSGDIIAQWDKVAHRWVIDPERVFVALHDLRRRFDDSRRDGHVLPFRLSSAWFSRLSEVGYLVRRLLPEPEQLWSVRLHLRWRVRLRL